MAQWEQVKAIVDGALEREGADRSAYVERACTDDAVRAEVESLLASYDESASFFDTWEEGAVTAAGSASTYIGPYRVLERLGRGGMGAVYRAERDDTPFQRQVALKVLPYGQEGDDFARRFFSERQILASLTHPHIARLYDGGLTEDGRPYFAMELIKGRSITQYCAEERLTVTERLQLFVRVAGAVRYAHRNLVVHRDLKPSNILITEDGTPKLLDFGIAKLLDEEVPHTRPLTRTGQLLMTPEYAAPEQVKGEAITTSTDVYQLGVLLYELLAGQRPHEFARKTPSVIERVILEEEPAKPSTAVVTNADPDEADRVQTVVSSGALEGDLDTIVLKALRKEPERRYGSVRALVEDVERHLEGRPITARPVTWRYQARKFVQRNRWSVGAVSVFVALLVAYAATVTVQARQIATERDRAQAATMEARQSAQKSQQMSQFLVGLFEEADPRQSGGELSARDLLDQASAQLDTSFMGYPAVEADLLEVIGNAYRNQGHYQETYDLHRRSLALRAGSQAPSRALAMAQNNVGEALYYLGRYDEAVPYYQTSLQMRQRLLDSSHVDIAQSLNNLALIDMESAHYEQAQRRFEEALAIFQSQLGEEHWRTVNILNNLAQAESRVGDLEAAERHYRKALNLRRRIRSTPDRDAAIILNNLGGVLLRGGRFEEAEQAHRQALRLFRKVTADDAPFIGYGLLGIARSKHAQGHNEEAERLFGEALTHHRDVLPEGHERIARPLLAWGRLHLEQDRPADAEPLLQEALQIREQAFPEGHWKTAEVRRELASSLMARRRYVEAEDILLGEYDALRKRRTPPDRHIRAMNEQLVRLYEAWGKPDRATPYRDTLQQAAPKTAAADLPQGQR